jgi:sulfur-oxidizing protein SoxZ
MSTIKIRSKHLANYTLVRTLIAHPMETGKRKDDDSGELVPAHFIQTLNFKYNDQPQPPKVTFTFCRVW